MRVDVVDPSAYTLPYDHSLCAALAGQGADVRLITSTFAYGEAPMPEGYVRREFFYRLARGRAGSRTRQFSKLLEHGPDMARYRVRAAEADVVHFQWLPVPWLDRLLLPSRPTVLTAHDLLPREPRPGQVAAQRRALDAVDGVVVHSRFGRDQLVDRVGVAAEKVTVVHHGAFDYLARLAPGELPRELTAGDGKLQRPRADGDGELQRPLAEGDGPLPRPRADGDGPPDRLVVLFFGLLRPYKGLDVLLQAWSAMGADSAELWIVGHPRIPLDHLLTGLPAGVRVVPRYVSDAELAGCFGAADLVVLPYLSTERFDFSGVLATALAFGKPAVISDVGGFAELASTGAARLVPPGDAGALAATLSALLADPDERRRMGDDVRAAAAGPYSWQEAARRTLALYETLR